LWPAIIAHFVYDGFAVVMVYFNPALADQDGPTLQVGNQLIMAIISAILVAAVIYQMKKKSTNSYEIIYDGDKVEESNPFS
jgi:purine-cytosine permease-like protein